MLPYVIPPIALVAGIRAIQPHARWFLNSDLSLIPFYTVLALPFTFRALDAGVRAIDVQDARRRLARASAPAGARRCWRALIPNLRTAIISSSFLTATVVLGEFTIATVLLKQTLPTFMVSYQQQRAAGRHRHSALARARRHHAAVRAAHRRDPQARRGDARADGLLEDRRR